MRLDHPTALVLYKSLFVPHFNYCDTIYMCTKQEHSSRLQPIQNIACRTILLADRFESTGQMHTSLDHMLLQDRRNLHMGLQCHKSIYVEGNSSLGHFYEPIVRVGARTTCGESNRNMQVPRCRTRLRKLAYSVHGPVFWKSLRKEFTIKEDFVAFKSAISKEVCNTFENHPT